MSDKKVSKAKVGRRFQIVIPAEIRKDADLKEGDEVLISKSKNVIVILPKPKSYANYLLGLHQDIWEGIDAADYLQKERELWEN